MARHSVLDVPVADVPVTAEIDGAPPRLDEGVELVGEYRGSGYQERKFLVNRADGQVIQLPHALYLLATALDGQRDTVDIAASLSTDLGREISAEQVAHLIDTKLRPAGIAAADPSGPGPAPAVAMPRPDPLLLLRFRLPVVTPDVVWRVAGLFTFAHRTAVVVAALAAFVAVDIAVLAGGGLGDLGASAIAIVEAPALALLVIAALLASGVFHECGHVSACRFGGARPGVMGVGLYLVWPAFYSTVTDSYRLGRAGRLRTDLGGVYFNAIFMAATGAAYLTTGSPWLLVALLTLHVETVRQFLPSIRLDGYYILSDLIGLPDLFMFLRPVLTSVLPGRPQDPRVAELKPGVRRVIVAWVLIVVPLLLGFLVLFVALAPQVLPTVWAALLANLTTIAGAVRTGETALVSLTLVQTLMLLLPVLGVSLILGGLGAKVLRWFQATPRTQRADGPERSLKALLVVAVPIILLGLLGLAGLDQRVASGSDARTAAAAAAVGIDANALPIPGMDLVAAHQIAALDALLGGLGQSSVIDRARAVLLLVGVLGALLLWPVARGLRLPGPAAGLVVAIGGLPALLTPILGTVDPGALAAVWLTAAAALVGRGRGANTAALLSVTVAVLTAPVTLVGVLAFGAHGIATGQLATGWRRGAARGAALVLGATAIVVALRTVPVGTYAAGAFAGPLLATVVVLGAVVVAVGEYRFAPLRPVATAAGALLVCAAVPGPRAATAMLLVLPVLAVLIGMLVHGLTGPARPARSRAILAAALITAVLACGPSVAAASATAPDAQRLAAWVQTELDPTTILQVEPLVAAQLIADGVPADRLVPVGDLAGSLIVGGAQPGPSTLLELPAGPGGAPVTVQRGPSGAGPSAGTDPIGSLLADNPRLSLPPDAAAVLREDGVDPRLVTTLAGLTGVYDLDVAAFPAVPGEPSDALRRTAVVTAVDGVPVTDPAAAEVLTRWLDGQQPPYRPSDVTPTDGGLAVHYTLLRRPA